MSQNGTLRRDLICSNPWHQCLRLSKSPCGLVEHNGTSPHGLNRGRCRGRYPTALTPIIRARRLSHERRDHNTVSAVPLTDRHAPSRRFDQHSNRSDGRAVLLMASDRRLGLLECLAGCLRDDGQPGKIENQIAALLAQRVYAIACGCQDTKHAARLADDPVHKGGAGSRPGRLR